jgi:hypothetical protein
MSPGADSWKQIVFGAVPFQPSKLSRSLKIHCCRWTGAEAGAQGWNRTGSPCASASRHLPVLPSVRVTASTRLRVES